MEAIKIMLTWKDEYSIGIDLIDAQHKHLFEIGNSAYELLNSDFCVDKYDRIVAIIQDLSQYTKFHFKSEEDYMLQIKYRQYFSQKVEHDDFIEKIYAVKLDQIDINQEKYIEDLLVFIFNWIVEHILKKDKLIKA